MAALEAGIVKVWKVVCDAAGALAVGALAVGAGAEAAMDEVGEGAAETAGCE